MIEPLLEEIGMFLEKNPTIAESTFGRLSVNDGKLVSRLKQGGQVLPSTASRIREFIDNYNQ